MKNVFIPCVVDRMILYDSFLIFCFTIKHWRQSWSRVFIHPVESIYCDCAETVLLNLSIYTIPTVLVSSERSLVVFNPSYYNGNCKADGQVSITCNLMQIRDVVLGNCALLHIDEIKRIQYGGIYGQGIRNFDTTVVHFRFEHQLCYIHVILLHCLEFITRFSNPETMFNLIDASHWHIHRLVI